MQHVEFRNEENLSTQQQKKEENTRLSPKNEYLRRTGGNQRKEKKRPRAADAVARNTMPPGSQKFSRQEKVLRSDEYRAIYRQGKKFFGRFVNAFCLGRAQTCRLGITVTRAVGNAAERNKIKRRIREIFRKNKHLFEGCETIVIHVKPGCILADYALLAQDIENLMGKIKKFRMGASENA
jgi:ribonuclease P protein component